MQSFLGGEREFLSCDTHKTEEIEDDEEVQLCTL